MAIICKITVGFVSQRFDTETRRFVNQEFIANDGVTWENEMGDELNMSDNKDLTLIYGQGGVDEPTLNMEMVQPLTVENFEKALNMPPLLANARSFELGEQVLVTPFDNPDDLVRNEFMGTVVGFRLGSRGDDLITVKNQDDQCFDVDAVQVHHVK